MADQYSRHVKTADHKVQKKRNDQGVLLEWKEWIDGVLIFDVSCDLCNYDKHKCHGCGDPQRHDGKSTHDGHTVEECYAYD